MLTLICSGGSGQSDAMVVTYSNLATPIVTGLEDRGNLQAQNGHDRDINLDTNKPSEQSPQQQQQQQLMSSAKPENVPVSFEASVSSMETTGSVQQQASSALSNTGANQKSKVSTGSTQHSDAKLKSTGTTRGTGM